jgi:hypothetical protein
MCWAKISAAKTDAARKYRLGGRCLLYVRPQLPPQQRKSMQMKISAVKADAVKLGRPQSQRGEVGQAVLVGDVAETWNAT